MGWQTDVITQIVFNKETYNSIYEIEEEIECNNKCIQNIKDELYIMTTARPEDLLIHNEEMDLLGLQRDVRDKLELLEESIIENYKLEILRDNFNLRDGDYINNPEKTQNIKKWLVDNFILESKDINNESN